MEYEKVIASIEAGSSFVLLDKVKEFENAGIDQIYISYNREKISEFFIDIKKIISQADLDLILRLDILDFECLKRAIYTGAKAVVLNINKIKDYSIIKEGIKRFGKDKIIVEINQKNDLDTIKKEFLDETIGQIYIKQKDFNIDEYNDVLDYLDKFNITLHSLDIYKEYKKINNINGFVIDNINANQVLDYKNKLLDLNFNPSIPKSKLLFDEFSLNNDGLIPVVVQEYITGEVLMLAYMNKESYNITIETGVMTYFSRSRKQLWIKGETSGHYQYLKEINIDCDRDTLIAKVSQDGVACHTGKYTCFFTNLFKKESNKHNPLEVLNDVYKTILDRKLNPKEGSYTNFLFEKGIDKILKKCGEEATEIIIAAKNPDSFELKYEIADFMYHMMVLMVETNLDWNDIINELADRK